MSEPTVKALRLEEVASSCMTNILSFGLNLEQTELDDLLNGMSEQLQREPYVIWCSEGLAEELKPLRCDVKIVIENSVPEFSDSERTTIYGVLMPERGLTELVDELECCLIKP